MKIRTAIMESYIGVIATKDVYCLFMTMQRLGLLEFENTGRMMICSDSGACNFLLKVHK